jgi:hypothetical protein
MIDGEINQWASHLPALMACAAATDGPIIECGVGFNSTTVLHAICAPTSRRLFSLEGNPEWLARFGNLVTPWHTLHHVGDWGNPPMIGEPDRAYGMAFVDHDREPRGPVLPMLMRKAKLIVMHDSECNYCGYTEPLALFDWCYTHKHSPAWTTVAGMGARPAWLEAALPVGDWSIPVPYRG